MDFRVRDSKNPCTRQQNHAPRVQGAPLILDTEYVYGNSGGIFFLLLVTVYDPPSLYMYID